MDEGKIENIANNLRKGMNVAADLAEEVGRVAKAKLDVALAKKQIHRMQTELGAFVFRNINRVLFLIKRVQQCFCYRQRISRNSPMDRIINKILNW